MRLVDFNYRNQYFRDNLKTNLIFKNLNMKILKTKLRKLLPEHLCVSHIGKSIFKLVNALQNTMYGIHRVCKRMVTDRKLLDDHSLTYSHSHNLDMLMNLKIMIK